MYFMKQLLKKGITRLNFETLRNFQKLEKVYPGSSIETPTKNKIDSSTIDLLERLSLVDCVNKKDIQTLEAAIEFADQIFEVDTTGVTPLITVLEDYPLRVRVDEVTEGGNIAEILKNASVIEEEYFVAPPGNIPLEGDHKKEAESKGNFNN